MKTTKLRLSTPCPACHGQLHPSVLTCSSCQTEIKGPVAVSPLMRLDQDMLHFLMVFIHCGGKISDMEKALGVSYPTVKAKMSKLQELVNPSSTLDKAPETKSNDILEILKKMESGDVDYTKALKEIKNLKK